MTNPIIPTLVCIRCGHVWIPNVPKPQKCPRCLSSYWNREKVRGVQKPEQKPLVVVAKPEFTQMREKLNGPGEGDFQSLKNRLLGK